MTLLPLVYAAVTDRGRDAGPGPRSRGHRRGEQPHPRQRQADRRDAHVPGGVDGSRPPVHRTLTKRTTVQRVIRAVNGLQPAKQRIMCPMIMILGPILTVVFKAGPAGPALAQAQVQVRTGTQGDSGASSCFPIRLTARGVQTPLIGNSFVRLMGGLIGVQIS